MDFLNKLYESNYFGIGLFAVISFLVVTFLVVLFFGKRDEHKRKQLDNNDYASENHSDDAFKEASVVTPLEVPVAPVNLEPVTPFNFEEKSIAPVEPIIPIVQDAPTTSVTPQIPVNPIVEEPKIISEPIAPIIEESKAISPIINEPIVPIVNEPVVPEPIVRPVEPIIPVVNEPVINPVPMEPVKFNIPSVTPEPKVMEPIKITIPEEPVFTTPIIQEEVKPLITPTPTPVINEPAPIIEEPTIQETYYKPVERIEPEEVKVPNIDFDAIAQSISKELDELEKSTVNNSYDEVKVTPINEIAKPQVEVRPTASTGSQFSSVYVTNPSTPKPAAPVVDLPKKIDLPTKKVD